MILSFLELNFQTVLLNLNLNQKLNSYYLLVKEKILFRNFYSEFFLNFQKKFK